MNFEKYFLQQSTDKKNNFFNETLKQLSSDGFDLFYFTSDGVPSFDGLTAFKLKNEKYFFYLILMDPSIRGGTFSIENLNYLHRFFDFLESDSGQEPLIFGLNSAGVRLTQSRTMFNSVWGVLPRLFQIRKKRPYFAFAHEMCLGAGALFFGQAHLRIVSGEKSLLNLTGPQVITHFFGKDQGFHRYASAEHQIEKHLFINEIYTNLEQSLKRIFHVLDFINGNKLNDLSPVAFCNNTPTEAYKSMTARHKTIMNSIADYTSEIFPFYSHSGLCFLAQKDGNNFGIFINPIDHPINTLSVNTIEKYIEAITLFKSLKIPIISITDTPGGDPRQKNSDQNVIMKTLNLIELMIDYPYPKIGLIAGRCFGGSGLLALPIINKSMGLYAIEGSKIGAMSDESIERLAVANPRSYAEWKESQFSHKSDLSDLIKSGNLSGTLSMNELSDFITKFLTKSIL